jgi:hypothetical protein
MLLVVADASVLVTGIEFDNPAWQNSRRNHRHILQNEIGPVQRRGPTGMRDDLLQKLSSADAASYG